MRASIIGGSASTRLRAIAGSIDVAVLVATAAVLTATAGTDADDRVPLSLRFGGRVLQDGAFTAWLAASFTYFVMAEWLTGSTVGKQVVGLRVRMADGRCCTLSAAIVRNLLRVVDAFPFGIPNLLGFLVVAGTPRHQRLGDLAAQTIVVRTR
jgi:uncharacterized RDD family membrane protein YckC